LLQSLIIEQYDLLAHQGGVSGKGGSVIRYDYIAKDPILNISITPYPNDGSLLSSISGMIVTEIPEPASLFILGIGMIGVIKRKH
jgi:hypothetical protein